MPFPAKSGASRRLQAIFPAKVTGGGRGPNIHSPQLPSLFVPVSRLGLANEKSIPTPKDDRPVLPPGLPTWITPEAVADTLATWQPYYRHRLTVDDAVAMLLDLGNLFALLYGD